MSEAEKRMEVSDKILDLLEEFPGVVQVGILEVVQQALIKAMMNRK